MSQTSFLPPLPAPTTREKIEELAKDKATPRQSQPLDFGLFGERQLDICDLIQAPR